MSVLICYFWVHVKQGGHKAKHIFMRPHDFKRVILLDMWTENGDQVAVQGSNGIEKKEMAMVQSIIKW